MTGPVTGTGPGRPRGAPAVEDPVRLRTGVAEHGGRS